MIGTVKNARTPPTAMTGPMSRCGSMWSATRAAAPRAHRDPRQHRADDRGVRLEADPDVRREDPTRQDLQHQHRGRTDEHDRAREQRSQPRGSHVSRYGLVHRAGWNRSPSMVTSRPHHSSTVISAASVGVVVAGDDARAVGRGGDDRRVARLATLVRDRVAVDGCSAAVVARDLERGRPGFDVGTGVGEREPAVGRCRRPHRDAVLGDEAADEREQTGAARRVAQHRHHAGEGLEGRVVERAPAEGHAPTDAQGPPVGIVDRKAELLGLDAHRDGEAAVEIDHVARRDVDPGEVGDALGADAHSRRPVQLRALRHREHVVRLDRRERVHALLLRDAGAVGRGGGAEHERRGLVDVPLRAVPLGVRRREHRVLRRRVLEELRRHRVASPRVGVGGGRAAERRPQLGRGPGVLGDRLAARRPQRGLQRRVHQRRGSMNPAARSGARDDLVGGFDALVGCHVGALRRRRPG